MHSPIRLPLKPSLAFLLSLVAQDLLTTSQIHAQAAPETPSTEPSAEESPAGDASDSPDTDSPDTDASLEQSEQDDAQPKEDDAQPKEVEAAEEEGSGAQADEAPPEEAPPEETQSKEGADAAAAAGTEEATGESEEPGDEFFEDEEELAFEAVAEVESPPREPTKRTVEKELLTRVPGTRGDALRAIEVMPGVSRTNFAANDGAPMLRGSYSDESIVLLDGAPVPAIYHFGGLTSFFNSQLLESVNLYPGNYSARYGRAAGGVVEARVRDPKTDKFHAMLELSAIDSFALTEAPLTDKTSIALAARRSNIDFFFKAFVPDGAYAVLAAPVYYDYQAILVHRFNEQNKLRVLGYGSHDHMEFFLENAAPGDPALRGDVDVRSQFHRLQVEMESQWDGKVEQKLMASVGPSFADTALGDLSGKMRFYDINARADWSVFAHERLRIDTGLDFQMFGGTGQYTGPAPQQDEGNPTSGSLASETYLTIEERGLTPVYPAAYVEASYRPIEEILLVPGLRADYTAVGQSFRVDPRFTGRFTVASRTTLKTGVGLYSQPPQYFQVMEDLGNPDATPFRTLQTSLGVEQGISEVVKVDVDGFYKHWDDRLIGTPGAEPPGFVNEGTGRAYGAEFLLDMNLGPKSRGLLAYTLSRSERKDGPDADYRLFDFDQTHNLSVTLSYDLGKGWIAGARFRYVTGNPYTPVVAAVYDATTDTYRGLPDGINTERDSSFHQLDLRIEKLWTLGPVGLTTYLEVFNVYNRKNADGVSYSFDYSETEDATGMPFFPNLGIRGEL